MKKAAFFLPLFISSTLAVFAANPATPPDVIPLGVLQPASSWQFSNGAEFPGAKGSLAVKSGATGQENHLAFDFTGGGAYVAAISPINVSADYAEIRLSVKAAKNTSLSLRLQDSTGQWHQIPVKYDRAGEWQTIRYDLKKHRPGGQWGGAADGVLHFPLTSFGLVLPNPKNDALQGTLLFNNAKALR